MVRVEAGHPTCPTSRRRGAVGFGRGTLAHQGWQLGFASVKAKLGGTKKSVSSQDIVPRVRQKGVDMRIGLDIASLALKGLVSTIVLVTGDSDFAPAMKLARREGLRVILDPLGSSRIRRELKVHATAERTARPRPPFPD